MKVSWKQSSASWRPTDATRNRWMSWRCSSSRAWNGGSLTPMERAYGARREIPRRPRIKLARLRREQLVRDQRVELVVRRVDSCPLTRVHQGHRRLATEIMSLGRRFGLGQRLEV